MHTQARVAEKITLAAVTVIALVALPAMFVLATGSGSYEVVFRVFPGYGVALGSTLLLVVSEAASLLSIGGLVYLLFLRDVPSRQGFTLSHGMGLVLLRIASVIWAVAAGALVVFDALDSTGVSLVAPAQPGVVSYVMDAASNPGALVIRFVAAAVVALTANLAARWTTLLVSLWASAIAGGSYLPTGQLLWQRRARCWPPTGGQLVLRHW